MSAILRASVLTFGLMVLAGSASAADRLALEAPARASSAMIRVVAPDGSVTEYRYAKPAEAATVDLRSLIGASAADGSYRYEISYGQTLDKAQAQAAADTRRDGSSAVGLPEALQPVSGSFMVAGGQIKSGDLIESDQDSGATPPIPPQPNDQVIADDLIVQGSACLGLDCVNNESFGFDTLRLKENNTRIKFDDTSVSAAFPATDWQLTANDSASGGLNKFSIEDITDSKVPLTVVGNAPTNSLYIDSTGRIGLRTSTPVLDLHIATSNTPGMRLEQTSAGGFAAQTWDVAGNESNFFVRDVTSGSRLPFRIRPGAPTSSIDINANGNVGIGTASPQAKLHVEGDAYIAGTLTQLSSRTAKTNLVAVAADGVLDQLGKLPIWTWNYLRSSAGDRHIGPVAEDFYAAFGFGTSERQLAPSDVAGVALAATQALQREVAARDRKIEALEARLARLEKAMTEREATVESSTSGH
jgi:hypothetical protein